MLAFQSNPNSVLLTFINNAANNVNTMILSMLFKNSQPIGNCQLDSDTKMTSIYQGMRVMITQNRDKKRNIINGQMATIHTCHNATVILKLPNNKLVATRSDISITRWIENLLSLSCSLCYHNVQSSRSNLGKSNSVV